MAKIFFSYSHDDEQYRDQLEKLLALLKHQGLIDAVHDRRIDAGSVLDDTIDSEIDKADIILLLVSSSFLASRYCFSFEMTRAMDRHAAGAAKVVPVIVRTCDWHSAPFGKLLATPKDGRAITSWPNFDEAYADVARQIRELVEADIDAPGKTVKKTVAPSSNVATTPSLRSSNLRLKKEFTELDRDRFLHETFEFSSRFFQGSLSELEVRNASIQCRFTSVDGSTFTAAIYRDGKKESECAVSIGSSMSRHSSITFSHDASARGGSFNESLSVEADDQCMYLKALGMVTRASGARLSQEGAAEFLWSMLIERLQ